MASIGIGIAEKYGLSRRDERTLADTIDNAISDAFKTGFEHACVGGKEAARKLPQLKDAMPLVLYFGDEKDRQEFADMIHAEKPDMIECKIPEGA
jgi:hypothetical protein